MKKKLFSVLTAWVLSMSTMNYAWSAELIKIYSPYNAGHSATPAMRKIVDTANDSQSIYRFVLEFRPGGNQVIAVKSIESENSLAIIAPAFVENVASGQLDQRNYVPVHALGDACWAVIANKPLKGAREFTVGGVGFGNAAHLTALALGEKYGFKVRYVVFKSNYDALVNMAGNNGVELVIDKYEGYQALRTQNPRLQMIAASCPQRLPQEPQIKTLKEMGITAPYIFNIAVAHRDMDSTRRQAIGNILNQATEKLGAAEIYRLSAMRPPMFDRIGTEQFYSTSTALVRQLQEKYKDQINSQK